MCCKAVRAQQDITKSVPECELWLVDGEYFSVYNANKANISRKNIENGGNVMEEILCIRNLCKRYPSFALRNVSFAVEKGRIMGFVGRNGAGKTTTLKSIMNLVHPDSGEICFFGMELGDREQEIKQRIGYAAGGISYYHRIPDTRAVCRGGE